MAMETDSIPDFLLSLRDDAPEEFINYFLEFEDFWERKLWHELTDKLVEYFNQKASAPQRIPLYETFIKNFADKINQLKLVTLGLSASTQYKGKMNPKITVEITKPVSANRTADDKSRLKFLEALAAKVNKPSSQDAYVYATVAVANILLRLDDYDAARKKLDECEKILDTFDSVETVVHAAFYKTNAEYFQVCLAQPNAATMVALTNINTRRKKTLLHTIAMPSYISRVSNSLLSLKRNNRNGPTISALLHLSRIPYTTLASSSSIQS